MFSLLFSFKLRCMCFAFVRVRLKKLLTYLLNSRIVLSTEFT